MTRVNERTGGILKVSKFKRYYQLRGRARELRLQGYKYSALWNKLAAEFPKWTVSTIRQICGNTGYYRESE